MLHVNNITQKFHSQAKGLLKMTRRCKTPTAATIADCHNHGSQELTNTIPLQWLFNSTEQYPMVTIHATIGTQTSSSKHIAETPQPTTKNQQKTTKTAPQP